MPTSARNGSYGWPSILLHWIGAGLLIALYLLAERFEGMARGPERLAAVELHAAVGMTAFLFLAARVILSIRGGHPDLPPQRFGFDKLAKAVHWLMLAMIAILIIGGPLIIWSAGRGIDVFGLLAIPSPLWKNHALHEMLEGTHAFAAHAILPLFALHVIGALKNLLIDRDGIFLRMLRPERPPA